jgi:hypothetical protein
MLIIIHVHRVDFRGGIEGGKNPFLIHRFPII